MKQTIEPLFSKALLVVQEFIPAIFPLFPYFLNFIKIHYQENKEIRKEVVCVALATKGAFENKGCTKNNEKLVCTY